MHNVADDPAYAAVRAELEAALWRAQAAVGDAPHPDQPVPALVSAGRASDAASPRFLTPGPDPGS